LSDSHCRTARRPRQCGRIEESKIRRDQAGHARTGWPPAAFGRR